MMRKTLAAALCLALPASAPALAQSQQPAPPPPCQEDVYGDFDFWLGTWDVTTPAGQTAGVNVISELENGCLLLEEWTSAGGGTGQSYNFYDPGLKKWRQIWVSGGATSD